MDFAGTPSNTNSNNINGSVNANVGAINSDYQDIVNMSTVLFGEPGTTLTLTGNAQEINVPDTGPFDANGNYIYTATSGFNVQNTLYINGDGTHSVVINIPADAAVKFGAPILLTGDVTALTLTTVGHGFTPGTYALTISAPTSGMPGATTATGTYTVNAAGQVSGITLTNGGRGYSPGQPINVTFGGGGGSGATALATLGVLNDNQVMYNLDPSPGNTTEIHGGAGINNLPVNGIIVGATAKFNVDNLVSAGHLYLGGTGTDFQLVSNIKNLVTPITVNNTATLNGTLTASAGVTISYNQSLPPLTAAGTLAAHEAAGQYPLGSVRPGVYTVAVDGLTGAQSSAEQARISDAIAGLNATFAPFGVTLTEVSGAAAADASVHIRMATTTVLGNTVNGVLGDFEGSTINLVTGWNWYTGSDPRQIGADQYDFETIVMHELGHVFGLGESADPGSVMYYQLAPGEVRLGLTASDLAQLEDQGQTHADTIVSDTTAAPVASRPTPAVTETRSDNPETADANPLSAQAAEPADEIEADNAGNASLVSTGFSSPPDRGRGNPAPGGGVPLVLSIGGTNLGGWPIVEPLPIGWVSADQPVLDSDTIPNTSGSSDLYWGSVLVTQPDAVADQSNPYELLDRLFQSGGNALPLRTSEHFAEATPPAFADAYWQDPGAVEEFGAVYPWRAEPLDTTDTEAIAGLSDPGKGSPATSLPDAAWVRGISLLPAAWSMGTYFASLAGEELQTRSRRQPRLR